MMTTTQTPKTLTLFGKTLELRGDNGTRASWRGEHDGIVLYVYRGPEIAGFKAKISARDSEGAITPIAGAEGTTVATAEDGLRAALRRLGIKGF